ncbi:signal peptidase I [Andreprevotia chitinilytica]|uniref:signal peptidase I n=1 Tax=Andreprevotia chitinilytica TaxID=396808 RepID=UPI000A92803F|nr:signal peptidase I [Andreprevotia chitinilytica]
MTNLLAIASAETTDAPEFFSSPASSMEPTIKKDTLVVVNKYQDNEKPQRGDIVVFYSPENEQTLYIKRVVGVPGEKISIKNASVYISGSKIEEAYILPRSREYIASIQDSPVFSKQNEMGEGLLSENDYFVLGDNRYESLDSRFFGPIKLEKIKGKVTPWDQLLKDDVRLDKVLNQIADGIKKKIPLVLGDKTTLESIKLEGRTFVSKVHVDAEVAEEFLPAMQLELKSMILGFYCKQPHTKEFVGISSKYLIGLNRAKENLVVKLSADDCR